MSSESEAVVLGMWDDYDREGLPGILRWARGRRRLAPALVEPERVPLDRRVHGMHRAEDVA